MISIIIPAYKAENFIEKCLDSIAAQTFFIKNPDYEILIGIDACIISLHKVSSLNYKYNNLRIFYFNENIGPYIIKNTLVDYTKYNGILFFDVDDIMKKDMIEKLFVDFNLQDIVRFDYVNFTDEITNQTPGRIADGIFLIHKEKFDEVGGFAPWRCAADTDFHDRALRNNLKSSVIYGELFYRRLHGNNLTQRPNTGFDSPLRLSYKQQIADAKKHHILRINKIINTNHILL